MFGGWSERLDRGQFGSLLPSRAPVEIEVAGPAGIEHAAVVPLYERIIPANVAEVEKAVQPPPVRRCLFGFLFFCGEEPKKSPAESWL